LLKDYPASIEQPDEDPIPPKTAPRASSAKASPAPVKEAEPALITLEEVRAKLAAISQAGKKTEVAALINEFGVSKLTEVKSEDYAALMAKAEKL
jgi:hypothetical protein